jgi:prepilin-type N-terminal cleavage/methylation domain-containing protein
LKSSSGFTLVEMIIVILIIGILAVYVYIQPNSSAPVSLYASADFFMNDIRFAQALSMTKGHRFYITSPTSGSYEIIDRTTGVGVPDILGNPTSSFSGGVTFGTVTNLPNGTIEFDGRGVPYVDTATPGTQLTAPALIGITNGSQTITVTLNPQTGSVSLQ